MSFWSKWQLRSQAGDFLKALRKQRVYNSDLLAPERVEEVRSYEAELGAALKGRGDTLPAVLEKGDRIAVANFPSRKWDAVRENVEVIFVAIVAALALRAYFLQPFKIPTDSMKPTLYGIQVDPADADTPAPSLPARLFEQFACGRTYGSIRFDHPVTLVGLGGGQITPWFEYTDFYFDTGEKRRVWADRAKLAAVFGLRRDQTFAANQDVVRFVKLTGDQVLVNKLVYNFRTPRRGEVFVFRTTGIAGIEDRMRAQGLEGSEFYIKRCVGQPGDLLRVVPPNLEINGTTDGPYQNAAMRRVEAAQNGYRGYSGLVSPEQHFLRTPEETYQVDPDSFWAMGDNSFNSLDSRFWGVVPRPNLVGTGFIVYWPFGPRWGFIH